jgi:hypothetical protein
MESITKDIALLVVGIAAGFLPWLVDKVGIEMSKYGVAAVGTCAIISLAWGLNNLVSMAVPKQLRSPIVSPMTLFFTLSAFAIFSWWVVRTLGFRERVQKVKTELRLRFSGKPEKPVEVHNENIESWYTVWGPSAAISFADANQKELNAKIVVPENWVIFVLFRKLITYRELDVSFSHPGFPQWETKQSTSRFAIITVSGSIPVGNLEIYAK